MKITWFGDNIFRLYVGGQIIVTDPRHTPADIDTKELTAGADVLVDVESVLPDLTRFTKEHWRRGRPKSMLEESDASSAPAIFSLAGSAMVLDSIDESRLIVSFAEMEWDRFADDAIVVLTDAEAAKSVLNVARPKLIALATAGLSDEQFEALAKECMDCALQVLEPGLAIEA